MSEPSTPAAPAIAWAVHGVAILIGEAGVLIRGDSGSGKTSLALSLLGLEQGVAPAPCARLVGDDRLVLQLVNGRLLARPHPEIAGLIEKRGEGIFPVDAEPAAVIRCVVDLVRPDASRDIPPRLPSKEALTVLFGTVALPRLCLPQRLSTPEGARRVRAFVHRISP